MLVSSRAIQRSDKSTHRTLLAFHIWSRESVRSRGPNSQPVCQPRPLLDEEERKGARPGIKANTTPFSLSVIPFKGRLLVGPPRFLSHRHASKNDAILESHCFLPHGLEIHAITVFLQTFNAVTSNAFLGPFQKILMIVQASSLFLWPFQKNRFSSIVTQTYSAFLWPFGRNECIPKPVHKNSMCPYDHLVSFF